MTVVQLPTRFTIGGSDAAAAAGVDPHRSRVMLWLEKTGRIERPETEAMRWGKLLEPLIFEELRERGYDAHSADDPILHDRERLWLNGHPDGFVGIDDAPALLEVKTVGQWAKREWNGEPPLSYVAQVQHYLHLAGLDRALLAVLVGGQKLELTMIERNQHAIDLLLEREEEFHGFLVRDELPAPDGSASAREALAALYPDATAGGVVRLDKEGMRLYHALKARREQRDAIDRQVTELENRLKAAMGEAESAISPHDDELIRWRNVTSTRTDVQGLREAHPEIASAFVIATQTRRFQAL